MTSGATTHIYALCDPESGAVRYVGKSNDPVLRLKHHLEETRRRGTIHHRLAWIQGLLNRGLEPRLRILDVVPVELWEIAERAWIADLKAVGAVLVNITQGGEGGSGPMPSHVRAKISAGNSGKRRTAEQRARYSAGSIGKKMSPEARAKMSAYWTGRPRKSAPRPGMQGSRHHQARLTESDVRRIRDEAVASERRFGLLTELAEEYGVTPTCILHVINRKTWTHLV